MPKRSGTTPQSGLLTMVAASQAMGLGGLESFAVFCCSTALGHSRCTASGDCAAEPAFTTSMAHNLFRDVFGASPAAG